MANRSIGRPLTILLHADTTGLAKGMADAQKKLEGYSKNLEALNKKAAIAFGGVAVAGFSAAKAAAEDERSSRVLAKTLKNVTGATNAQVAAVEDYISKTSLALGIADDELRPAYARLVRSTEDAAAAQTLLNLSLDISAATGKDVNTVAAALGKGWDGSTQALGRLGLGIDAQTLKSKDFGKVLEVLGKKFSGFAKAEAATGEGSFKRLTVALDESKEAIGRGLLPYVQIMADNLGRLAPKIGNNAGLILKLGGAVVILSTAIIGLNYAIKAAIAIQKIALVTGAALKIGYLTLAAATGSATAAQTLAELTYKRGGAAIIAHRAYVIADTIATKGLVGATKQLTVAMLSNPWVLATVAVAGFVYIVAKASRETNAMEQSGKGFTAFRYAAQENLGKVTVAAAKTAVALRQVSNAVQESRDVARSKGRNTTPAKTAEQELQDLLKQLSAIDTKMPKVTDKATKQAKALEKMAGITEKATAVLDGFQAKLDDARANLDKVTQSFNDYRGTIGDVIKQQLDFSKAFESKGKGTFLDSLQEQATKAKDFGAKIAKLVSMGLSKGSLDKLLTAGADVGGQIADELIRNGIGAVQNVNRLTEDVNTVADAIAQSTASAFYDTGLIQGQALVNGIITAAKKAGLIYSNGSLSLPGTNAKITGVANSTVTSNKLATSTKGMTSAGNINITINGAVDPEATRRQLETLFQQSARRTGAVNFVGATL